MKNFFIAIFLLLFLSGANINAMAPRVVKYGDLPKNAGEAATFRNVKNVDSTKLDFSFKFEKQSNIPLLRKSTRILAKEIVEKEVASEPVSPAVLWEMRIKTLKALDDEAEEYLTKPVLASETKKISD